MACLYCNKEVPFRMRLTGEEQFCCPAHKRQYNDEHNRIGLARLLEEVSAPSKKPEVKEQPSVAEPSTLEHVPGEALDEPRTVATVRGLDLWVYPRTTYSPRPKFRRFLRLEYGPAEYRPDVQGKQARAGTTAPTRPRSPQSVPAASRFPTAEPVRPPEDRAAGTQLVKRILDISETNKEAPKQKRGPVEPKLEVEQTSAAAPGPGSVNRKPPENEKTETVVFRGAFGEKSSGNSEAQNTTRIAAGVVLAICLGAGGYLGLDIGGGEPGSGNTGAVEVMNLEEWIPRWSDGEQGEEIALFGPSQEWSDYRVEWDADADAEVAWVFRAANPDNYYAIRLERAQSGQLKMVRYAIIEGARTAATETALQGALPNQRTYAVRLEVKGPRFTLFVEGDSVADWTDDRLYRGGFGIIRPDMGLAGVGDVKVTRLARESASQRESFWQGTLPGRLPDVTLIGRRPSPPAEGNEGATESSL